MASVQEVMGPKRTFSLLGLTVGKHRSWSPDCPPYYLSHCYPERSLFLGETIWFSFFFKGINLNSPLKLCLGFACVWLLASYGGLLDSVLLICLSFRVPWGQDSRWLLGVYGEVGTWALQGRHLIWTTTLKLKLLICWTSNFIHLIFFFLLLTANQTDVF